MTQHHAIRGNLADVSAKDSAQETAVNLIASVTALVIITLFGNSLTIFLILIMFHIIFNYLAVRSVCLRTLNEPRYLKIIEAYLGEEVIANPCGVNKNEPIILFHLPNIQDRQFCGFSIKMGHSMKKIVKKHPKASYMKHVQEVYKSRAYLLLASIHARKIYVLLRDSATTSDVLCAYFHAVLYGIAICAINDYALPIYKKSEERPYSQICRTLHRAEWSKDHLIIPIGRFKYEPSLELMLFMNNMIEQEWPIMKEGLKKTGWDLTKHLLVVDEWRICTSSIVTKIISTDTVSQETHKNPKLITFNEIRDKMYSESSEETAYMIEPDKQVAEGIVDSSTQDDITDDSTMRIESVPLSPIQEERCTHEQRPDQKSIKKD